MCPAYDVGKISLGAVCKYKGDGMAETETWVFVPNKTFFIFGSFLAVNASHSHFRQSEQFFFFVFWVAFLQRDLDHLQHPSSIVYDGLPKSTNGPYRLKSKTSTKVN